MLCAARSRPLVGKARRHANVTSTWLRTGRCVICTVSSVGRVPGWGRGGAVRRPAPAWPCQLANQPDASHDAALTSMSPTMTRKPLRGL